jgi:hypothetical protein
VLEQEVDLAEEAQRCPCCGLTYEPLASVETSDVIEVSVRAYVRRVRRKRYRRTSASARPRLRSSAHRRLHC